MNFLGRILLLVISFNSCISSSDYCLKSDFFHSAYRGDLDSVKVCINLGVNINKTDSYGNTVLMISSTQGHYEIADFLLKKNAVTDIINKQSKSAGRLAADNFHFQIETLIKKHEYTHWSVKADKFDFIEFEKAIALDNHLVVQEFIKEGFDFKSKNTSGITPIVNSIFSSSPNVVKILVENGVSPNEVFDFRPLIVIGSMFGENEIVEILLSFGAEVNETDGPGQTALMFASESGFADVVLTLLENGADRSILDLNGETALDKARRNQHTEVIEILGSK